MNLRHLEIFHAIMATGSATKAAKLLEITQPAISTMLAQYEAQLGLKLFERSQGRLYPTPEANALFPDVANIFKRIETVDRTATNLAQGRQGKIAVAASMSIANGLLASAVPKFLNEQPDVEVSVHALPTARVVEYVAQREVDFGIGFGPVSNPDVVTDLMASSAVGCCMLADHPLAALKEIRIEQLAGQNIVVSPPFVAFGKLVDEALRKANVEPARKLYVNYSMTAGIMASKGAGIAIVESYFGEPASPSLVSRPLLPRIPVEVVSIEPHSHRRAKATELLLEIVRKEASLIPSA